MSLGPVIGNRFSDAHRATLKPHLCERLALLTRRNTPLGTINTDADGRQSFVPNYLRTDCKRIGAGPRPMPRSAFRPGQRVRVDATVGELLGQEEYPFEPEEAAAVAGQEGVVIPHEDYSALGLVFVKLHGVSWAVMPAYLRSVSSAEGDDELAAMADYTCPF